MVTLPIERLAKRLVFGWRGVPDAEPWACEYCQKTVPAHQGVRDGGSWVYCDETCAQEHEDARAI